MRQASGRFPWKLFTVVAFVSAFIAVKMHAAKFGFQRDFALLGVLFGWLIAQLVRLQRRWLHEHEFLSGKRRTSS